MALELKVGFSMELESFAREERFAASFVLTSIWLNALGMGLLMSLKLLERREGLPAPR